MSALSVEAARAGERGGVDGALKLAMRAIGYARIDREAERQEQRHDGDAEGGSDAAAFSACQTGGQGDGGSQHGAGGALSGCGG